MRLYIVRKMSFIFPPEAELYFDVRTAEHIRLVVINAERISRSRPELASDLMIRANCHDASKFIEPEKTPYIWLTWWHRCRNLGLPFDYPPGVESEVKGAIAHHFSCNRHHWEFFSNPADEMTDLDICEMVADWAAITQELGKSEKLSPRSWWMKLRDLQFSTSPGFCLKVEEALANLELTLLG